MAGLGERADETKSEHLRCKETFLLAEVKKT